MDGENAGDILSQRGFLMTFILLMFLFSGCVGFSLLLRLSLAAASRGCSLVAAYGSHGCGFSCCGAWALGP